MKMAALIMSAAMVISGSAYAGNNSRTFEVTVTNITAGQSFTPLLAVTHSNEISVFELGEPALDELELLAEGGMTTPLQDLLDPLKQVHDTVTTEGLLGPGESVTFKIKGTHWNNRLTFAGMLLPTNDTFVAVNSISLPRWQTTALATAYDAGTEINDEDCGNIPGPTCGGEAISEADGEGFIHVSNGIHGIGDLPPEIFDWRSAVAKVTVRRAR